MLGIDFSQKLTLGQFFFRDDTRGTPKLRSTSLNTLGREKPGAIRSAIGKVRKGALHVSLNVFEIPTRIHSILSFLHVQHICCNIRT